MLLDPRLQRAGIGQALEHAGQGLFGHRVGGLGQAALVERAAVVEEVLEFGGAEAGGAGVQEVLQEGLPLAGAEEEEQRGQDEQLEVARVGVLGDGVEQEELDLLELERDEEAPEQGLGAVELVGQVALWSAHRFGSRPETARTRGSRARGAATPGSRS